ncbi:ATP-binding cassette domain-containing protein [Luminiphilus sp.]|nr:ATP-binding cassette domain-containing protein [Luminiphilus sp.]
MTSPAELIGVADFVGDGLNIPTWRICAGQGWCVFGRNGSGKQLLDRLLVGKLATEAGAIDRNIAIADIALISFESQQGVYEQERRLAATDLLTDDESGTRVVDFLPSQKLSDPLIDELNLRHRLQAFYRELSTGESRKLLVLKALLEDSRLLVCDNPFDGLDPDAVAAISIAFEHAIHRGVAVVLLLSNRTDIPSWVTCFGHVEDGVLAVMASVSREQALRELEDRVAEPTMQQPGIPADSIPLAHYGAALIAELNQCTVRYGGRSILQDLSLNIAPLQHTLVTGENGAGKSTLLGLITGDCPQCFSNDVSVFGYRRGTGESVWEIKRHLGLVSNDLHRRYTVRCDVLAAVCSGFHDSIGVYDPVSDFQVRLAREWLAAVGMEAKASLPLHSLSYGEQRLVLIARAMVKSPLLLVLDEPTQGLDEMNRGRILDFLTSIEARRHSTLLFVSHRQDEHLPLFRQHIHLKLTL